MIYLMSEITFDDGEELFDVLDEVWEAEAPQVPDDPTYEFHEFSKVGIEGTWMSWKCVRCGVNLLLPKSEIPTLDGILSCTEMVIRSIIES